MDEIARSHVREQKRNVAVFLGPRPRGAGIAVEAADASVRVAERNRAHRAVAALESNGNVFRPPRLAAQVFGEYDLAALPRADTRSLLERLLCLFDLDEVVGRGGHEPKLLMIVTDGNAGSVKVERTNDPVRQLDQHVRNSIGGYQVARELGQRIEQNVTLRHV